MSGARTVTLLFTDLVGSTAMLVALGEDRYDSVRDEHDVLVGGTVVAYHGEIVKSTGDGYMAVFARAADAVGAAAEIQRLVSRRNEGSEVALGVRIGISAGDVIERAGDYQGVAAVEAARLCDVAAGGQILASETVRLLVGSRGGHEFVALGELDLKDLPPLATAAVRWADDAPVFPPLRALDVGAALPVPATSFHGRADELAELSALLTRPGTVTLVGPGGVGKTRLAVELAAEVGHQFRDGVRIIELAPVGADAVPATLAAGLGLVRRGRRSFRDSIVGWLARKQLLFVVDNCEHVLGDVAPLIRDIAETSSDVTVLCTSLQPLGFPGEIIFSVEPLGLPSTDDPGTLESSPAVRLFVDRAEAARYGLQQLGPEQLELVAQICRRLDGIPLAVELAAARARSMSLHDLLAHLHPKSPLLATPTPDHPRHRTFLSTIEWSYDLLTPESRAMFDRLSVFSGSWSAAAARRVCVDEDSDHDALSLLADLADRSMIVAEFGRTETRYRMLSTLRDFAADRLVAAGDADERRARHADFYCDLAQAVEPGLRTAEEARWVRLVAADFGNLHAAHVWAIDNAAVDLDARLLVALWNYGLQRLLPEYFRWVEEALDKLSFDAHPLLADLHGIAALGAWLRGDLRQTMRSCRAAFDAECQLGSGTTLPARMAIVVAAAYAPPGNPALEPIAAEVPSRFLELVQWCRALDDPFWLGYSMDTASLGMVMTGELERAAKLADRALQAARQAGCPTSIAWALFSLATALEQSDAELAEQLLDEAVLAARSVDSRLVLGLGLSLQATLRRRLGRPLDAVPLLLELIDHWNRLGDLPQLWHTVREAAFCLSLIGEDATAVRLLASVDRAELVMPLLPTDPASVTESSEDLRRRLGDDEFAAASGAGAEMARETAVELAARTLGDLRDRSAEPH